MSKGHFRGYRWVREKDKCWVLFRPGDTYMILVESGRGLPAVVIRGDKGWLARGGYVWSERHFPTSQKARRWCERRLKEIGFPQIQVHPSKDIGQDTDQQGREFHEVLKRVHQTTEQSRNDPKMQELLKRALASVDARKNEDIDQWAERLAADVAHLTD